jgi:hypothetical protein
MVRGFGVGTFGFIGNDDDDGNGGNDDDDVFTE